MFKSEEASQEDAGDDKRYYITTAIDYPNAPPHIGHSLEKVAADVIARYHRLLGHDTYFSGGLGEERQPVVVGANTHKAGHLTMTGRRDRGFLPAAVKM